MTYDQDGGKGYDCQGGLLSNGQEAKWIVYVAIHDIKRGCHGVYQTCGHPIGVEEPWRVHVGCHSRQ